MTVRREIAEPRRETSVRRPGNWLRRLRRCLSRFSFDGDSPQQYGEGPRAIPLSEGLSLQRIGDCSRVVHE